MGVLGRGYGGMVFSVGIPSCCIACLLGESAARGFVGAEGFGFSMFRVRFRYAARSRGGYGMDG